MRHYRPLWATLFLALPVSVLGQTGTGLTGIVSDNTGRVVVGAAVRVSNVATGVDYRASTSDRGTYTFPALLPGTYRLAVEHPGFKKSTQDGIVIETGFTRTVDVRLEVGAVTESVTIVASTPLLETENSAAGQVIERTTVANMPLESRRGGSLVRLTAGVLYTGEVGGAEAVPIFTISGGRPRNQQWLLDGTTVQNTALGLPQIAINPPVETLQEFKVEANAFSAEIGRAGGGAVVMTSRSGTNQFHGAGYNFLRNDKMDARSFFARTKAPLRYNVPGVSLGGPIRPNKTFFFYTYEGGRRREGVTYSSDTLPRPVELTGDFSNRRDVQVRDPLSQQPFPGTRIPTSRIDPIAAALVKFYPAPNTPNEDLTRAPRANYIANASNISKSDYFFGRVDHNIGNNDRLFGRVIYYELYSETQPIYPNRFVDPRGGFGTGRSPTVAATWFHNFSPTKFNEFRFERLNNDGGGPTFSFGSNINQQVGLKRRRSNVQPDSECDRPDQFRTRSGSATGAISAQAAEPASGG